MKSSLVFEGTGKMRDGLSSAVFIDRDGTIMEDTDYCSDPNDVRILPGVLEALRRLKSKEFKLIIITNQSGIGRGLFTLTTVPMLPDDIRRAANPRRVWL
jgi:histidinol-phosphate phosphatase family protein